MGWMARREEDRDPTANSCGIRAHARCVGIVSCGYAGTEPAIERRTANGVARHYCWRRVRGRRCRRDLEITANVAKERVMSAIPSSPESLEQRAREQRQQIHRTALELVSKMDEARQKLTLSYNVRAHFLASALIVAAGSLIAGYEL